MSVSFFALAALPLRCLFLLTYSRADRRLVRDLVALPQPLRLTYCIRGMALVRDSIGDFLLFPRDHTHFDMPPEDEFNTLHFGANTRSDFQQQYPESSSYDSYPAVSVYSSAPRVYYTTPEYHLDAGKGHGRPEQQRCTPGGSPSPSISQAFDHPASTLSSASAQSVRSTASSAIGSPYSHATHALPGQDQWTESQQGLGIAPGIVHNDGFGHDTMFSMGGMDNDMIFDDNKLQNSFVGEFGKIPSSSVLSSQPFSSVSSSSALQPFIPVFSSPPTTVGLDSPSSTRNVTIDTILEEANNKIASPRQTVSPTSAHSTKPPLAACQSVHQSSSSPIHLSSFKSPTTPASAISPYLPGVSSPSGTSQHDPRSYSGAAAPESRARSILVSPTDRFTPYARSTPPIIQDQFPIVQSLSSFFSQSSGRFIPPLESSCWFSLVPPLSSTVYLWISLILYLLSVNLPRLPLIMSRL